MNIQHLFKGHTGKFFIAEHGESIAEMVYKMEDDNIMVIVHTEVNEEMEGQGIGLNLVDEAVNYARKNLKKLKATCSFAKSVLNKNDSYKDVYVA